MKRTLVVLLALVMLLALTACAKAPQENAEAMITRSTEPAGKTEPAGGETEETKGAEKPAAEEAFSFAANGITVVPGEAFDPEKLPADSVYQVPSCAIEGMDNVYQYGSYEITAFSDGKSESVYSIFLMEPDVATPEGLALGDEMDKAASLYGQYKEEGTAWVFTRQNTQLWVIGQDGVVISIEIRLVTE